MCVFVTLVIVQLLRFFHPHPSLHQGNLHTRAAGHIIVIIYGYFYIPGTIGVNDTLCIPPANDSILGASLAATEAFEWCLYINIKYKLTSTSCCMQIGRCFQKIQKILRQKEVDSCALTFVTGLGMIVIEKSWKLFLN